MVKMTKEELTKEQQLAKEYVDSPVLIVAGPGAGKTKVLVHKAKYLMDKKGIKPSEIIMTTFTVKASEEMRQRIEEQTEKDISSMFIGTVHSLCENIIKEYGSGGVYTEFEILDDFKRYLFIKRNLNSLGLKLKELKKIKGVMEDNELIVLLSSFYDTLTENLVDIEDLKKDLLNEKENILISSIIEKNEKKEITLSVEEIKTLIQSTIESYRIYIQLLNEYKYLDFANLEMFCWKILESEPNIANELHKKIKYVLVDEFQDINPLQWKILSKIIHSGKVTCVGDRNQAIYGFRGSNPNIFDKFFEEYPDAKKILLDTNFRSRKEIVDAANIFMQRRQRKIMHLKNNRNESTNIYHVSGQDEIEEARNIMSIIKDLKSKNKIKSYGDVAILFRSVKYHGETLISVINNEYSEIPYAIFGGSSFIENEEVQGILFLLSYVYDIKTEEIKEIRFKSLKDILKTSLFRSSADIAEEYNWPEFSRKKDLEDIGLSSNDAEKIIKINNLREKITEKKTYLIQEAYYELLGILNILDLENDKVTKKILFNLGTFSGIINDFSTFYTESDMLLFIKILRAMPENINFKKNSNDVEIIDTDSLYLMNIHQAKGLEFPVVIVPSLINRRFPSTKGNRDLLKIPDNFYLYEPYNKLQEEENLFYVAITRSMDVLFLTNFESYSKSGRNTNGSIFLYDLLKQSKKYKSEEIDKIQITGKKSKDREIKLMDYSAVSTFIDCPERFKINYLYGFEAAAIFEQRVGLIYHNAISKINQEITKNNKISNEKITELINDSWIDLGQHNDVFKNKIHKGIRRYVEFMNKDFKRLIAIEKQISIMKDGIRIRGRADFIYENKEEEIVVLDYKSRKLKSINETHVDYQLKFYSDSLKKDGQKVDKAIAYPIEEENLNIAKATIKLKDDKEIHAVLNDFVKAVKTENYCGTSKGSGFCKKCPYRHMCKYYSKVK